MLPAVPLADAMSGTVALTVRFTPDEDPLGPLADAAVGLAVGGGERGAAAAPASPMPTAVHRA